MTSYLPIALLICLQLTGGWCQQCGVGNNALCPWQIAVIVMLSIALFLIIVSFVFMAACGAKSRCKAQQSSGDVYLQNMGCRSHQQ